MPLKLIECILPWFVGSLSEEEASSFLQNMYMAGLVSILTLLLLLSSSMDDVFYMLFFLSFLFYLVYF